jgi:hypothetical protein
MSKTSYAFLWRRANRMLEVVIPKLHCVLCGRPLVGGQQLRVGSVLRVPPEVRRRRYSSGVPRSSRGNNKQAIVSSVAYPLVLAALSALGNKLVFLFRHLVRQGPRLDGVLAGVLARRVLPYAVPGCERGGLARLGDRGRHRTAMSEEVFFCVAFVNSK